MTRVAGALATLQPDAVRLNVSSVLASIPMGFLVVILPIYFSKVGLDSSLIGALFTVSSLASAVLLIAFGYAADRVGRKPFVALGTALPIVSYVIFLVSTDPVLLAVAAAIGGVGLANGLSGSLVSSSFNALLAEKSDGSSRTFVFSLANATWSFALMVGSLLSGLPELLQRSCGIAVEDSYRPMFMLAIVLASAAALVLAPIRESHVEQRLRAPPGSSRLSRRSMLTTAKLALFMGLIGLALGFGVQLLSLWFYLRFDASGDVLGPWFALSALLSTAATLAAAPLARRMGAVQAVLLTQGSGALFLGLMILAPNAWMAAALYVARSVLMNVSWPIQQSYTMGVVRPAERATVSSVTFAAWGLASAVSPVISGAWLDQGRLSLPLIAGAACYALSALVLYGFFHRVRPPEEEEVAARSDVRSRKSVAGEDSEGLPCI